MKLDKFIPKFKKALENVIKEITNKENMTDLKNVIVDMIKIRVTAGFGVRANGRRREKFTKLSKSYKKARSRFDLGPNASKNKSNLHKSSTMIETDLDGIILDGKIFIGMKTDRSAKIAAFVSEARPFLFLTGPEIKKVNKKVRLQVAEIVRKQIKNLK